MHSGRDELHGMQGNAISCCPFMSVITMHSQNHCETCSVVAGTGISGRTSFLHSPPRKVPRWKGRTPYPFPDPKLPTSPSTHTPATAQQPDQDAATSASGHLYTSSSGQAPDAPGNCPANKRVLPQRYRLMHQLTQALEAGDVQRVRQQLGAEVGTDVLQRHPELSFELYR